MQQAYYPTIDFLFLQSSFSFYQVQISLLCLPTQIRLLIGGKRVTCQGSKMTNSLGKQQQVVLLEPVANL